LTAYRKSWLGLSYIFKIMATKRISAIHGISTHIIVIIILIL